MSLFLALILLLTAGHVLRKIFQWLPTSFGSILRLSFNIYYPFLYSTCVDIFILTVDFIFFSRSRSRIRAQDTQLASSGNAKENDERALHFGQPRDTAL